MSPLLVNGKTEKELLKACLSGDRSAQRDIFYLYSGKMMAVCQRFAKNRHEAEDVLQDAFVKVFTHMHEFANAGSFEGWVRRIVINTAIKNNLKNHTIFQELDPEHVKEDMVPPEVFSSLSEEELIRLITSIPDGYRTVFNLYVIEGFTHKEIAEMFHIEEATSRSQLAKARRLLQEKVTQLYKQAV